MIASRAVVVRSCELTGLYVLGIGPVGLRRSGNGPERWRWQCGRWDLALRGECVESAASVVTKMAAKSTMTMLTQRELDLQIVQRKANPSEGGQECEVDMCRVKRKAVEPWSLQGRRWFRPNCTWKQQHGVAVCFSEFAQ